MAAPIVLCTVDRPIGVSWSTDNTLLFAQFQRGLSSVAAEGGEPRPVTALAGNPPEVDHHNPVLLPGGEAVLFTIHEGKEQFSIAWRRDGRELFFRWQGSLLALPVDTAKGFSAGKAVRLFEGRYVANAVQSAGSAAGTLDYDVAPDGRFLMVKPSQEELASARLHVVLNWADELARRVPAGKGR